MLIAPSQTVMFDDTFINKQHVKFIEVYKCVNNMNPQYLNEIFTLKKCTYDLRDNSLLERPAGRLTNYGLKSFKS